MTLPVVSCMGGSTSNAAEVASPPMTVSTFAPPPSESPRAKAGLQIVQLRHAYRFDKTAYDGSRVAIGIVTAFSDPTIETDLTSFDVETGLPIMFGEHGSRPCSVRDGPHPCFAVYDDGAATPQPAQWAMETSLDVQWAHAMAVGADIVLEEARSDAIADLIAAVDRLAQRGVAVIAMSWGVQESTDDRRLDSHFRTPGVMFVAAAGDNGHGRLQYPASSPWVVAVGGTRLSVDNRGVRLAPESAWPSTTGGISITEPLPPFQAGLSRWSSGRMVPDVSYAASVDGGYEVYSKAAGLPGWFVLEADSAGPPQWAAIIAIADEARRDRAFENSLSAMPIYTAARNSPASLFPIVTGSNGTCGDQCAAGAGYNLVTGLGTPNVAILVNLL